MRLAVVGGDDQMMTGGGVFAQKFTVSVTDGNGVALVNAPVRFAVTDSSDGLLRAEGAAGWAAVTDLRTVAVAGGTAAMASVELKAPSAGRNSVYRCTVNGQTVQITGRSAGLALQWSLDGLTGSDASSVPDSTGLGRTGLRAQGLQVVAGPDDTTALRFAGASQTLGCEAPPADVLPTSGRPFSVSFWISPELDGTVLSNAAPDGSGFRLWYEVGNLCLQSNAAVLRAPLPARMWSHVVLTFSAGTARIYVDGATPATGACSLLNRGGALVFGGGFSGALDRIRVHRGVELSAAEVAGPEADRLAPPTLTPAGGSYTLSLEVGAGSPEPGARIQYTFNGQYPDSGAASVPAGGAIPVVRSGVLKAVARKPGRGQSVPVQALFELQLAPDRDTDGDGIPDAQEGQDGTRSDRADSDGDGISDSAEKAAGTNPMNADTDGDGVNDADDAYPLDPLRAGDIPVLQYLQTDWLGPVQDRLIPPVQGKSVQLLDTATDDEGNLAMLFEVGIWVPNPHGGFRKQYNYEAFRVNKAGDTMGRLEMEGDPGLDMEGHRSPKMFYPSRINTRGLIIGSGYTGLRYPVDENGNEMEIVDQAGIIQRSMTDRTSSWVQNSSFKDCSFGSLQILSYMPFCGQRWMQVQAEKVIWHERAFLVNGVSNNDLLWGQRIHMIRPDWSPGRFDLVTVTKESFAGDAKTGRREEKPTAGGLFEELLRADYIVASESGVALRDLHGAPQKGYLFDYSKSDRYPIDRWVYDRGQKRWSFRENAPASRELAISEEGVAFGLSRTSANPRGGRRFSDVEMMQTGCLPEAMVPYILLRSGEIQALMDFVPPELRPQIVFNLSDWDTHAVMGYGNTLMANCCIRVGNEWRRETLLFDLNRRQVFQPKVQLRQGDQPTASRTWFDIAHHRGGGSRWHGEKCWIRSDRSVALADTAAVNSSLLLPIELVDINDHENTGDDLAVQAWDTTKPIADSNIAWIDAHTSEQNPAPRMPQLELRMPGLPQGLTIEAKLEVKYERGNGARHPSRTDKHGNTDTVKIPADGSFKPVTSDTWQIWNEYPLQSEGFFGGDATLTYKLKSGTSEILAPQTIKFRIGGKNPDDARCRSYIEMQPDAGPNGSLWFAYAIAKSESKDYNGQGTLYNQFLELPTHVQDAGRPLWGNDGGTTPGGYGMFQVTGDASDSTANIPRKQIWNWQENVRAALAILASKRTAAVTWMTQQKNGNNASGTALPNHTVGIVTFSEGTAHTMTHAVAIKLYNGASRAPAGFVDSGSAPGFRLDPQGAGHYCFWRNASNEWALNRFNDPPDPIRPFNYVARVCGEVEN